MVEGLGAACSDRPRRGHPTGSPIRVGYRCRELGHLWTGGLFRTEFNGTGTLGVKGRGVRDLSNHFGSVLSGNNSLIVSVFPL